MEEVVKGVGGKVDAFYYAFGDSDAIGIIDVPDHIAVTAISLTVKASGAVSFKTSVLLTPEEIDQATKMTVRYRAPGQ